MIIIGFPASGSVRAQLQACGSAGSSVQVVHQRHARAA
jgi:hypothetical protein